MRNKCENCGECCIRTEMILTQQDIDLIIQRYPKKIKAKHFVSKSKSGFFRLKNIANYCVFLDYSLKKCMIYDFRPSGCRFYPLIFNFHEKRCVFDEDCPRTNLFYQEKDILEDTCKKLKLFIKKQLNLNY